MIVVWYLFGVFSLFLIVLSYIDFKTLLLPDTLTLSLLWSGLGINAFGLLVLPQTAILGAISAYLSFFSVSHIYLLIRRRAGLGLGDAKLLAAIGAWLGWPALPLIVLNAALINLIWALSVALFVKPKRSIAEQHFPFGPALSLSAIGVMMFKILTFK